jgi:hypothetical protein
MDPAEPQTAFEPQSFFEVLLPAMLLERREAAAKVGGVIQFFVTGVSDRAWYADLTDSPPEVFAGEHAAPDVWLAIADRHVLPMILGDLDVEAALADGSLEVQGDAAVLEGLQQIFASGMTGMGILYAGVRRAP